MRRSSWNLTYSVLGAFIALSPFEVNPSLVLGIGSVLRCREVDRDIPETCMDTRRRRPLESSIRIPISVLKSHPYVACPLAPVIRRDGTMRQCSTNWSAIGNAEARIAAATPT